MNTTMMTTNNIININDLINNIKNKTQFSFKTITKFSIIQEICLATNITISNYFKSDEYVLVYYFYESNLISNPQFTDNKIYIRSENLNKHYLICLEVNDKNIDFIKNSHTN